MKRIWPFAILPLLLFAETIFAQDRCGTMTHLHAQLQADTGLQNRMLQIEQFTQNYVQQHPNGNSSRSVVTIPVVFHVLYNTSAQNISDAQCRAQIDQLNLDYARLNTDASNTPAAFASVAVNTNIQFCLAVRDPNGAATTGVIHKQTSSTSFSTNDNAKHNNTGGDDAWPAASYLNIWSCNLGGGLLGYSQFPGGAAATDGCVLLYSSIGSMLSPTTATPYNLGRTATHEVGHWLNLYHIWGDDGGSCSGSDNVNDTPNQGSENYGCPSYPHTDNCTASSPGVMFMNYMDYVDDACMNMFTQGQSTRMNALFASGGARVGILNSLGCVAIGPVCNTASGMNTTAITTTSATFNWTAVSGASSYNIQYRIVGTSTWITANSATTSYTANGLTPNSTYEWQVQTVCSNGGTSAFTSSTTFVTPGPPVANFVADVTSTCTGLIHFTDQSTGTPTAWQWNFGDGGTSSVQNPTHQYVTNGTFTVSLTATNSNGSNTATQNNYITVNKPAAPSATGASHCGPGTVSLSATTSDTIKWYAGATDATPVAVSNPFVTPNLTNTTTYYAEEIVPGTSGTVGPAATSTLGAGGYFSNSTDRYLTFNCLSACTLKSVVVNAQSAGSRVIALRDANGATLQSATVNLNTGNNTVTLNFSLPVANNLQLAINGTANLYRNNAVTAGYPFTLAGLVSITGSNAGSGYYYYFYNWIIQTASCVSLRAPVTATITAGLNTSSSKTDVSCYGGSNGSASITVSGGTPNYTYSWSSGQTSSSISNVAQGTYVVTVSDATGCSGTQSISISQPTQLTLTTNVTNATCGLTNGAITTQVSGGTTNYSYSWNNSQTTPSLSNLTAGNYSVTVTDGHSCSTNASATVVTSGSLNIVANIVPVSCFGGGNGGATVTATGGTPNYTYSWSNGQSGAQLSNVAAGTYTVSASDAGGCSSTQNVSVTQPTQLSVSTTNSNPSCGQNNGSIVAAASGGTAAYTYSWSTGASGTTITGLGSGSYSVTTTDNNSCSASFSTSLTGLGGLTLTPSETDILCYGQSNGTASVAVSGGASGYTYSWSNGGSGASLSNLGAGTYNVTVNDANNCSATASISVAEPTALSSIGHANEPLCHGDSNGSIFVTGTGGVQPYTFAWSTGATGNTISNLPTGVYTVTITDANNCTNASNVPLMEPGIINLTYSSVDVLCFNDSTGSVTAAVSGGTNPYSFAWSNGGTGDSITNLTSGNYSVTVTDAHSCSATNSVFVSQPNPFQVTTTSNDATNNQSNGSVSIVNIYGAIAPYTYVWNTGDTTFGVANLAPGTYTVTVTDSIGCIKTATAVVGNVTGIASLAGGLNFSIFPNPASNTINVKIDGVKTEATLDIKNLLGQSLLEERLTQGLTTISISELSAGVYLLELKNEVGRNTVQLVVNR